MGSTEDTNFRDAARDGDLDLMQTLVKKGANINSSNRYGTTALHNASQNNQLAAVDFLLSKGALTTVTTKSGDTPLHVASKSGHASVIEKLCKSGADVNAKNSEGLTSLHIAVIDNLFDAAKVLLQYRADPNMPNNSDQTPSQLCKDDKLKGLFAAPPTPAPAPVPASAPAPTPSPAPTPTTARVEPPKGKVESTPVQDSTPQTPMKSHTPLTTSAKDALTQPPSVLNQSSLPPSADISMNRVMNTSTYSMPSSPYRPSIPNVTPIQLNSSDPLSQLIEAQTREIMMLREEVRELREIVTVLAQNMMPTSLQMKIGNKTAVYRCDGLF